MLDRPHFFDLTADELAETLAAWGMARFRARQVIDWVYGQGVADPAQMTNLSKADRDTLAERMTFLRGTVIRHQSATDGTQKLLMEWDAGAVTNGQPRMGDGGKLALEVVGQNTDRQTECVMIPGGGDGGRGVMESKASAVRKTACISSQVGCPVGCRFCASGLGGLDANLTAGQIVEQVWQLGRLPGVGRITNVVFMGMGEPLANFGAVTRAAQVLTAPPQEAGMGISARKVTISTVGLPAQIRRLADLNLPITLAISLHAPNDQIRQQIIPWAERVTVEQLVDAGRYYFDRTGREVTLEYILLAQVNDQADHARELAQVAKRLRSNVNLIRYNEVAGLPYGRPTDADVGQFQSILRRAGVNVHIRASRGRDIAAACGQLRHEAKGHAA